MPEGGLSAAVPSKLDAARCTLLPKIDREATRLSRRVMAVTSDLERGRDAEVRAEQVQPFVAEMMNATSIAFDRDGQMYVSSRNDGAVYRVAPNGTTTEPSPMACLPSGVTKNVAAFTWEFGGVEVRSVTKTVTLVMFGALVG